MKEWDDRKNLEFTKINQLAQNIDYKDYGMINAELCFSRYSMDTILKEYSEIPINYKIHALFEHGVIITDYVGGAFRAHEYLPSIVPSKYRVKILEKQKNYNGAYSIGPYIYYADYLLNLDKFKKEKERLGKTLLVFPSHSIDGSISHFNYNNFIDEIKKYSENFDSVRICMYYKDVQLNRHKIYQKNGFEVVTAGHFNDRYFLPRLKSIISLSDMTISNDIGTHLGYCIFMNKPHFIITNQNISHTHEDDSKNSKLMMENDKKVNKTKINNENLSKINRLFSEYDEKITKDQYEIINYLWGFDEIKSPNELKKIIFEINENFSWIKYYMSGLKRMKNIINDGR